MKNELTEGRGQIAELLRTRPLVIWLLMKMDREGGFSQYLTYELECRLASEGYLPRSELPCPGQPGAFPPPEAPRELSQEEEAFAADLESESTRLRMIGLQLGNLARDVRTGRFVPERGNRLGYWLSCLPEPKTRRDLKSRCAALLGKAVCHG